MDIGPAITLGFDDRISLQQLVCLRDGFAVEIEIVGELADRGKGVTGLQLAGGDCSLDLLDELLELRHRVVDVDGDFHRRGALMYHLAPWYNWLLQGAISPLYVRVAGHRS